VKRLALLLVCAAALAVPVAAEAHPLGNFTINRYSELDLAGNRIYVLYVLDMAEIPTFQARQSGPVDAAAYARRIAAGARVTVDGHAATLVPVEHELAFPPGQGGLQTMRLEVLLAGPKLTGRSSVSYRDGNYAGRIGWKEVVARAYGGGRLSGSTVRSASISDRLLAYPKSLLQSPLDETTAAASAAPGPAATAPPALLDPKLLDQRVGVRAIADSGFAKLIVHGRLDVWFVLASLGIAFFWGAAHALSPGHGKSVVAAYLVGARGTPRHALFLGATVTATHTIGVFALGLVTLSLSQFILPDDLFPWLNLVSALLVVGVGVSVLRWRVREWRRPTHGRHHHGQAHDHHHHGHAHVHPHPGDGHDHDGRHPHDPALGVRRLLGIGISGGIIPCPTALVVLLAAISLHRIGFGLLLILAFSLGLAAAMSGVGLLAVSAKKVFRRVDFESGLVRLLPGLSAVVVLALGLVMTARALPHVT
jgi:ABC-type nickel/cobalt efflux system permease component RcnA